MLERKIDQGTVIYGIRSEKYSTTPCYGIIITARCDIAQKKVPKYYYLVAMDASAWFCSDHGYQQAYSETVKQRKQAIYTKATELELDGTTLLSVPRESLELILSDKRNQVKGDKKAEKKIDGLTEALDQYYQVAQIETDNEKRSLAIRNNSRPAIKCLKDIESGKLHHYYFLPQTAYLGNNISGKGLIVDMLEIGTLSLPDAVKITSPFSSGICFTGLPRLPEKEALENAKPLDKVLKQVWEYVRLKTTYWLENDSDFVDIEGTVSSPWCEHLMQRFSNVFIRIGLQNPTEQDFENVIANCFKEERK